MIGRPRLWLAWAAGAAALSLHLGARLAGGDRTVFLPGETTAGHHQIELACEACHTRSFADRDVLQAACEGCHAEALREARDSHPQSKFTDPRNAYRTALLDVRYCVTCHVEHRPAATHAMGVTLPDDFCGVCHAEIAAERPSHEGFAFDGCGSSGCHNFHDNRALYEGFLLKHLDEPPLLSQQALLERNFASIARYLGTYPRDAFPLRSAGAEQVDAPDPHAVDPSLLDDWSTTAHAANGVTCGACHAAGGGEWNDRPGYESCGACHASEARAFTGGRHGMRLATTAPGLPLAPLEVRSARLPMKAAARGRAVDCGSCHAAHRFDTRFAAVEACLGCHDDEHSAAYPGSPHAALAREPGPGDRFPPEAVTCATCHMPRLEEPYDYGAYVHTLVQHNQSDNLRPSDKMLRDVCMDCHGLGFSLDALADRALVQRNFRGTPSSHVRSLELAAERRRAIEQEREAQRSRAASSGGE